MWHLRFTENGFMYIFLLRPWDQLFYGSEKKSCVHIPSISLSQSVNLQFLPLPIFFFPLKNNKNLGKQYTPWLLQKRSLAQSQDACLSNTQKVTPRIPLARNNSQHDESTRKSIAYYNTLRGAIAVRAMWGNALAWTITFYRWCIHEYELYYIIWHAVAFDLLWLMTSVLFWPLCLNL